MKKYTLFGAVVLVSVASAVAVSFAFADGPTASPDTLLGGLLPALGQLLPASEHWTPQVLNGISFSASSTDRIHALRVFTDTKGDTLETNSGIIESANWSGYAVAHYGTATYYKSASGTWTVASAAIPPGMPFGFSSSWVGIGGFCENSACTRGDATLIQLGTESDVTASGTQYYAWYEMLPKAEVPISGFAIHTGDVVFASLSAPSSSLPLTTQSWILTLINQTTKKTWTKTVSYHSSELSSEWIEEAPSSQFGILPLANFGKINFITTAVNGSNSPAFATKNEILMIDPYGQTSNPSAHNKSDNGFNACWGNATFTTCVAPKN